MKLSNLHPKLDSVFVEWGGVDMLSFRASIVVTMLATFALSLGVMLWNRGSAEAPSYAIAAPSANQREPPPVLAPAPLAPSVARPPTVKEEQKAVTVPSGVSLATPADPVQLPVEVVFKRRERLNKFEGRIANTSGDPLLIDVRVLNASTHYTSQAQVSVGAYIQTRFGIDDGLDMQSGDQVTLKSDLFRDQVLQIP
jgi:hypothetical protein